MVINQTLLDELTAQARASGRLRQELDMRNSPEDGSQRMLVAMEPGTVVPVHRHQDTSKTVLMVRGHLILKFFDSDGREQECFEMYPIGDVPMVNIPVGQWHTLESLESGTVVFIAKDGFFKPVSEEDVLSF